MEAEKFKLKLENAFANLQYVKSCSVSMSKDIVKGTAVLEVSCSLEVYYNAKRFNLSFALVSETNGRIWGIDRTKNQGWHRHPLFSVETHESIEEMGIDEIMEELSSVCASLL